MSKIALVTVQKRRLTSDGMGHIGVSTKGWQPFGTLEVKVAKSLQMTSFESLASTTFGIGAAEAQSRTWKIQDTGRASGNISPTNIYPSFKPRVRLLRFLVQLQKGKKLLLTYRSGQLFSTIRIDLKSIGDTCSWSRIRRSLSHIEPDRKPSA